MAHDLDEDELRATRKLNGVEWEKDKQIQVGDYVRCKNGKIAKVKDINEDYIYFDKEIYWQDGIPIFELDKTFIDFIKKHSPNLIDLIEIGDYVNGYRVKETGIYTEKEVVEIYAICHNLKEIQNKLVNKKWYELDNADLMPLRNCKNDSIKNIVTKEQFNSVMYKVKE